MKVKFVYKVLPVFIFYSDLFLKDKDYISSRASCCFIQIRKIHDKNNGLLQHEITHVKQFYRTFGLHIPLYRLSKNYRLKSEVEAYANQILENKITVHNSLIVMYSNFIVSRYNVGKLKDVVNKMLRNKINERKIKNENTGIAGII